MASRSSRSTTATTAGTASCRLIGTIQFNRERGQSLLCAVLRPGNAGAALGLVPILERLLEKVRAAFPKARIRVRLDGGFGNPTVLDYLDTAGVEYVVGLANWPAAQEAEPRRRSALRCASTRRTGRTHQIFGETMFKTKTTWPHPRRVIYKAEVVDYPGREPRQNLRFVVTNFKMTPKRVYREYCKRGDPENRIKELKHGLELGRTSCSSFLANQLRVQITAAAYVLMQELARQARHTDLRDAQVTRLRDRLLRLPVWVEESVRRVVLHLPTSFLGQSGLAAHRAAAWCHPALIASPLPGSHRPQPGRLAPLCPRGDQTHDGPTIFPPTVSAAGYRGIRPPDTSRKGPSSGAVMHARWDLRGGRPVRAVPTAINSSIPNRPAEPGRTEVPTRIPP